MTLPEQLNQISERIERTGMRATDALSLINMTFDEQMKRLDVSSPYVAFAGLSELIDRTVRGTKVERFRPRKPPALSYPGDSHRRRRNSWLPQFALFEKINSLLLPRLCRGYAGIQRFGSRYKNCYCIQGVFNGQEGRTSIIG